MASAVNERLAASSALTAASTFKEVNEGAIQLTHIKEVNELVGNSLITNADTLAATVEAARSIC